MQCLLMKIGQTYKRLREVTNFLIHLKLESLELDLIQYFMLQVILHNYTNIVVNNNQLQ